jgi:ferredoxin
MKVRYDTEDLEWDSSEADNLLQLAIKKKIPISHSCEGMASCGTCRVLITQGVQHLPERNSLEQEMSDDRKFAPEERLACQLELSQLQAPVHFKLPND